MRLGNLRSRALLIGIFVKQKRRRPWRVPVLLLLPISCALLLLLEFRFIFLCAVEMTNGSFHFSIDFRGHDELPDYWLPGSQGVVATQ